MKSLVDVDFTLVEKHQIKDTINHYNAMCDNARKVIEGDPYLNFYISTDSPIGLELSNDENIITVQWDEVSSSYDNDPYLECKEHKLDIKFLTYSEAEIKSYLGARKKQYQLKLKEILEHKAEEREFQLYQDLKKKYEKD